MLKRIIFETMQTPVCKGISILTVFVVISILYIQSHYFALSKEHTKEYWRRKSAAVLQMDMIGQPITDGSRATHAASTTTTTVKPTTSQLSTTTTPKTIPQTTSTQGKRNLLILDWVSTYHTRGWKLPQSDICGSCELTTDHSRLDESDAVVFYMKGTDATHKPDPSKRKPHQVFAWWCHESPSTVRHYWHKSLTEHNNYFNVTMHFRSDSDIIANFMPHTARDWYLHRIGRSKEASVAELPIVTNDTEFEILFQKLMKVKTRGSAWVASDCDIVKHARERKQFVERIRDQGKYPVEMYGKCGTKELPMNNVKFFDFLQTFKFYFAFENTLGCKDYLTEKFWYNGLFAGAVPVIWGTRKESAERVAPIGSYIHSDDFGNDPVRLAEHLKMLEGNTTAYKKYFEWWKLPGFFPVYKIREPKDPADNVQEDPFDYEVDGYCHLCKLLSQGWNRNSSRTVPNLNQQFYGPESSECLA